MRHGLTDAQWAKAAIFTGFKSVADYRKFLVALKRGAKK